MAEPARIALLANRLGTGVATGIGRYYREIALALAAEADPSRLSYFVATPREPRAPDWARPPLAATMIGGPRRPLQMSWSLWRRPHVDRSLGRPDVVHALHTWAPTPTQRPLVVTIHDVMPLLEPDFYPADHRFGLRRGIAHARDRARLVIVDSQWIGDLVTTHVGIERDRVRVVHLGVAPQFRASISPETIAEATGRHGVAPGRYLLAVGAVSARKNLGVVVRALAQIDPELLGDRALLVAGPDDIGARELHQLVDELGLGGRVHFGGYLPDADLPPLLAGALALVHPSRDEGFGFTPLEAMAAGTPALASTSGSLPEVMGDAGVQLAPDDVEAWAAAIERVASDRDHRTRLVTEGHLRQTRFTWDRAARETMDVHLEVLAGSP